ncbi:hypothetical protein ACJX0J_031245, partial [Zea mays]
KLGILLRLLGYLNNKFQNKSQRHIYESDFVLNNNGLISDVVHSELKGTVAYLILFVIVFAFTMILIVLSIKTQSKREYKGFQETKIISFQETKIISFWFSEQGTYVIKS